MQKAFWVIVLILTSQYFISAQSNIAMPEEEVIQSWLEEHQVPAVGVGIIESGKVSEIKVFGQLKRKYQHTEKPFSM
ncbi:MAG: hypothetical protein AAGG68_04555 [Bacteroidota bacterium]